MCTPRANLTVIFTMVVVSLSGPATALDFGPVEFVQADGADIQVSGYSVPSFVDWNDDLLKDLIVGESGTGGAAKVRVYLNIGREAEPQFGEFFYAQSEGADLTCLAAGCLGCFPRVVDWDDDGRNDLLVGQSDGTVKIFLNVTDNNEPAFDAGEYIQVGPSNMLELDVGSRATPQPVDWNSDGLLDLVVGGLDGLIHVFVNCGCEGQGSPTFYYTPSDGEFAQADGRDLQVPGLRSSPVVMDLDGDGKKDLLTGNTDGLILFYANVGTDSLPIFAGYSLVTSDGEAIDLPGTPRSRPFICAWTGDGHFGPRDGYVDLLVGAGDGKVRLYRGLPDPGDFDLDGDIDVDDLRQFVAYWRSEDPTENNPADLNGDGLLDALDLEAFVDLMLAADEE